MPSNSPQPSDYFGDFTSTNGEVTRPVVTPEWRSTASSNWNIGVGRDVFRGRSGSDGNTVEYSQDAEGPHTGQSHGISSDQIASSGEMQTHSDALNVATNRENAWGLVPSSYNDVSRSWSRSGLLQPRNYVHPSPSNSNTGSGGHSHSGNSTSSQHLSGSNPRISPHIRRPSFTLGRSLSDIRASTLQLSSLAAPNPGTSPSSPYTNWHPNMSVLAPPMMRVASQDPTHFVQRMRTPIVETELDVGGDSFGQRLGPGPVSLLQEGILSPFGRSHTVGVPVASGVGLDTAVPSAPGFRPPRPLSPVSESDFTPSPVEPSKGSPSLTQPTHRVARSPDSIPKDNYASPRIASPTEPANRDGFGSTKPHPSALSLLLARQRQQEGESPRSSVRTGSPGSDVHRSLGVAQSSGDLRSHAEPMDTSQFTGNGIRNTTPDVSIPISEVTPLLQNSMGPSIHASTRPSNTPPLTSPHGSQTRPFGLSKSRWNSITKRMRAAVSGKAVKESAKLMVGSLPAVLLGSLLNILDGVSYGMIMFPATGVFTDFGGIGVSMFFVTTIISQLVYSFGGSGFAGANGSMMIEVVPFFHILANDITTILGEENKAQVVSTTIAAFALSSLLTGLTFFLLGYLKLGVVIGFFPRHILVGCIGGVGVFLIQTGLAVCARIDDDEFTYDLATLKILFQGHTLALWLPALVLAVLLRVITSKYHHQLIFPGYFLLIPAIFYFVVAAAHLPLSMLRESGWVFDMGSSTEPWYKFYSYYDIKHTSFSTLWATMPTQLALLFFNILHPPLNVPALAVSLGEDIDTNKELVAHGYSNILAGALGTVPNYLVYVNTLLFYRLGGTTCTSGFLLAAFTFLLLIIGTAPIGYIPIMVVGALIFVLGIDLVKEALWDTRHRSSWSEYLTITSIVVCMTLWDFVVGVLFGIVICCFFFVVQNSRRRSIRSMFTGELAMSAVRRPSAHRDYIRQVAKQTVILKLQGFLFFGTITQVEETIRQLVEPEAWIHNPVRFLVIDFSLVAGVDMSSAEAFVRIHRLLTGKNVTMVLCGLPSESTVETSLQSVGLFDADFVEVFATLGDALEWTENAYIKAWFMSQKVEPDQTQSVQALPGLRQWKPTFSLAGSFAGSPRRVHLYNAAGSTIGHVLPEPAPADQGDDLFQTLVRAFASYGQLDYVRFEPLSRYMTRMYMRAGEVLWQQFDPPDGLYVIESGVLRAKYTLAERGAAVEESMVGGTIAGELSALADLPRNATVSVEQDAILWKLSTENWRKLEQENPELARTFLHLVLKVAKSDFDILLSALAVRQ